MATDAPDWRSVPTATSRPPPPSAGTVRAEARFRDWDGEVRKVTAIASTAKSAKTALRTKLARRSAAHQIDMGQTDHCPGDRVAVKDMNEAGSTGVDREKDPKVVALQEVIERLNDLFRADEFTASQPSRS